MTVFVNDVSNKTSFLISQLQKLGSFSIHLRNFLVLDRLFLQQLGSISFGLFDGSNFLL